MSEQRICKNKYLEFTYSITNKNGEGDNRQLA